jgi:hypothetical protein
LHASLRASASRIAARSHAQTPTRKFPNELLFDHAIKASTSAKRHLVQHIGLQWQSDRVALGDGRGWRELHVRIEEVGVVLRKA